MSALTRRSQVPLVPYRAVPRVSLLLLTCRYSLCQSTDQGKLDPGVNRILFVRNLPFKITTEELFDVFGKYGAIRQMRV